MPQNSWIDPRGQQHQYTKPGSGLQGNARNALERERTWSELDPTFDEDNFNVTPDGRIVDNGVNPWLMGGLALSAPLTAAFLPGLLGGAGAAAAPGTTLPGATAAAGAGGATAAASAAGAAGAGGMLGKLKGLFTDPSNMTDLAGIITALVGASRGGGNGQQSAEAQRMQQMTEERMRRVDPLHQAVTQLAWGRLPVSARNGIQAPTYTPLP